MSKINLNRINPPENIADNVDVPEGMIYLLTNDDKYIEKYKNFLEPNTKFRPWFKQHFYFCLPLSMANQHTFIVRSLSGLMLRWSGGTENSDLSVFQMHDTESLQTFESHFGNGILTVQHQFTLRTPKQVNLMVKEPPNYPINGVSFMNGVVETDQLRRDFTFNLKVTAKNTDIYIPKNTPIGAVMPVPRYFHDKFSSKVVEDEELLKVYRDTLTYYNEERKIEYDSGGKPSLRYLHGEDIFGNKFHDHQKRLDGGSWWKSDSDE